MSLWARAMSWRRPRRGRLARRARPSTWATARSNSRSFWRGAAPLPTSSAVCARSSSQRASWRSAERTRASLASVSAASWSIWRSSAATWLWCAPRRASWSATSAAMRASRRVPAGDLPARWPGRARCRRPRPRAARWRSGPRSSSASSCAMSSRVWVASRRATTCRPRHAVAGADEELGEDAALEVLDGLALAVGVEDAVGDDGGVEAGEHGPAADASRRRPRRRGTRRGRWARRGAARGRRRVARVMTRSP